MPIARHPSRYWDCCMSEDEKKETEKFFEKGPKKLTLTWA